MNSFWFWKNWSPEYRIIWYGVAFIFVSALIFLWTGYFTSPDGVLAWEKLYDQKVIETVAHSFQLGNFEFSIPIESYLTFEYFNGSNIIPNTLTLHLFVIMLTLASLFLVTIITTFERFWFLTGMGLFILFIVSLRLEVLHLFGLTGKWTTIGVIAMYGMLGFYFHTFNTSARFAFRLSSFFTVTAVLAVLIYFFAGVPYPYLHLAVTGYLPGLILCLLFFVMIAHEILASFIYLTSQGATSSKSLRHFLIISVTYIANLMLAFMHEAGIIDWNFLYINLYLLLSVSAILSIWGYQQREKIYRNITSYHPFGAYFITGLAIISFSTIGMLLCSANDAALKVIRDFIIFSHLGFGLIFLLYVFSNFILMMAENMNVYKVLYTPNRMPYFTYRFGGFIAMLGFMFYSNWHEYVYHGTAGFYNSLGDLYQVMDKRAFAEAYYQQGRSYGFQNHHSNYVLGQLEAERNNLEQAQYHYELASAKRPTEYSLINNSNIYLTEERVFNGIFSLRKALHTFPDSGPIQNNLGYAYTKIHLLDSALFLFEQARKHRVSKDAAELNFTAFIAQEYLPVKADSLAEWLNPASPAVAGNALVIAATQAQSFNTSLNPLASRQLSLYDATFLNNYIVNHVKEIDTTFINTAFEIASDSVNEPYSEALKVSLAHAYYHKNHVNKALQILAELAYLSQSRQGKYNYIMGLWALEQGNVERALQSFEYAVEYDYKDAKLYSAIALVEAHRIPEALVAIDTLLASENENEVEIARQLKKCFTISTAEVLQQSDLEKYQFLRYRIQVRDSGTFNSILDTFKDTNYKAQALFEMAERQFNRGDTPAAIRYFSRLKDMKLTDRSLFERIQYLELELLASRGELRLLANKINEGVEFPESRNLEKLFYTALLSEAGGDTLTAETNYKILAVYNPFFEEGVIAAARYFKKHSADPFKAYTILTDAIHINAGSVRLLRAYVAEAARIGFDEYAAGAALELVELENREY